VTYLRAETNKNVAFSRGFLKKTDSQVTYEFTESVPLVGFQGYETQNQISSLGFISFNCSTDAITSIEQEFFSDQVKVIAGTSGAVVSVSITVFLVTIIDTALCMCYCFACVYGLYVLRD
jgi:hypothetical protein